MDTNKILDYKNKLNNLAELGWKEINTTKLIQKILKDVPYKLGFNNIKTGLVYKVGKGTNSILLRSDIDGLKTSQGIQHTCGHSTHMAALMGTYAYAKKNEEQLNRKNKSIYFLFQPAEETFPSGAKTFVTECGTLLKTIKNAYTIHVKPLLPLGTVGLQPGSVWARGDYMEITVKGKMVHVKDSFNAIDTLQSASKIILSIKKLQKKYLKKVRINIGVIEGGRQPNTTADRALLKGDIRLTDNSDQAKIKSELTTLCTQIQKEDRTQITLTYFDGCPTVVNNKVATQSMISHLKKANIISKITTSNQFSYGCEDFAYISNLVPSVTAFIGTGGSFDLHEEKCVISDQGTVNAYLYFKAVIDLFIQS